MTTNDRVDPPTCGTGLLDEEAVGRWLVANVSGLDGPFTFTRVGEGQSALSFRTEDRHGHKVVLRRPPIGELLESAHDMAREFRILTSLYPFTQKVPGALGLCEDLSVTGVPFYVMDYIEGLTLNRLDIAEGLNPAARAMTGDSLITTLVELQSIDLDAAKLGDLRRSASFIERQVRRWTRQWYSQKTRDLALVDELAETFVTRMPTEVETVLVHGDYGLHNVIVGPDGTVRSVLDWELCSVGDPLADLGQMLAYWTESGAPARQPNPLFKEPVTELSGFSTPAALVHRYAEASGRDISELGYWIAFAYWKTATIVEGVYSRWLENPANGAGAGELVSAVPRLAELAKAALETGV
ncbi:MAG: phosphotransferase family protein [Acidimicrobiales bacterium]